MYRIIMALAASTFLVSSASAACIGSGNLKTCYDQSGNSYTVQRFGNTTYTNGYNNQTGNSWSQTDQRIGNSVYTNGTAGNGNTWNMQRQNLGNGFSTYSGTDSNGKSFFGTCNRYGCD